jgi:hypothetical protein
VNEILEGESDGPFGHDDVEYDADIAKWCEKVVEKMPEMQEIFEEAFHQIMDFKGKLPASDNPRVRQIADEKVSEMMNQAAARLEIISHGLAKEIQTLCTGLAAGVAKESSKEASVKPSELSKTLRRIAHAIDKSRNPDRTLVARDLKKVIAAINTPLADITSASMSPDGLWTVSLSWDATDSDGVSHHMSGTTQFRMIAEYNSKDATEKFSIDGKSIGNQVPYMVIDFGDDQLGQPAYIADMAITEMMRTNPKTNAWLSKYTHDLFDIGENKAAMEELYNILWNGKLV